MGCCSSSKNPISDPEKGNPPEHKQEKGDKESNHQKNNGINDNNELSNQKEFKKEESNLKDEKSNKIEEISKNEKINNFSNIKENQEKEIEKVYSINNKKNQNSEIIDEKEKDDEELTIRQNIAPVVGETNYYRRNIDISKNENYDEQLITNENKENRCEIYVDASDELLEDKENSKPTRFQTLDRMKIHSRADVDLRNNTHRHINNTKLE